MLHLQIWNAKQLIWRFISKIPTFLTHYAIVLKWKCNFFRAYCQTCAIISNFIVTNMTFDIPLRSPLFLERTTVTFEGYNGGHIVLIIVKSCSFILFKYLDLIFFDNLIEVLCFDSSWKVPKVCSLVDFVWRCFATNWHVWNEAEEVRRVRCSSPRRRRRTRRTRRSWRVHPTPASHCQIFGSRWCGKERWGLEKIVIFFNFH